MVKSCGNCAHWIKLQKIKGLCEKFDYGWANSDSGAKCKSHKRIKYKRDIPIVDLTSFQND